MAEVVVEEVVAEIVTDAEEIVAITKDKVEVIMRIKDVHNIKDNTCGESAQRTGRVMLTSVYTVVVEVEDVVVVEIREEDTNSCITYNISISICFLLLLK